MNYTLWGVPNTSDSRRRRRPAWCYSGCLITLWLMRHRTRWLHKQMAV